MSEVREILGALEIEVEAEHENRQTGDIEYKARCPYHFGGTKFDNNPGWYCNAESGEHICFSCGFKGTLQILAYRLLDLDWDATAYPPELAAPRPEPLHIELVGADKLTTRPNPPGLELIDKLWRLVK